MPLYPANIDLSTLDGTTGFKISGVSAGNRSGHSVAPAGDVNGDGVDDLIVGSLTDKSYVVFGRTGGFASNLNLSSLDGSNGFRLSGFGYEQSGRSVASAGDINGDGFADLIVGARYADPNGDRSGASYVVFGTDGGFASNIDLSSLDGSNGFKLSGVAELDQSGRSVASAGDVNGDGFDDLIIGAPNADPHGNYSGASYVVFGKAGGFGANIELSSLDGLNGFTLRGAATFHSSGASVASAGDVNGDGFDDMIVGAPFANAASGASYVVFGTDGGFASTIDLSSLDGLTGFKLSGPAGELSGYSVASAGDVNGDGFADVIIGARDASPHGQRTGATYVVFGQESGFASNLDLSSLNGSNGFKLSGTEENDYSGCSVASAGDVNGDGFADVIVGARGSNPHGDNSGASYVLFGKAGGFASNIDLSSLDGSNGFKLSGVALLDFSGYSVASAGDVNGDGFDDMLVGARYADPNGFGSGASYVVFAKHTTAPVARIGSDVDERMTGGSASDVLAGMDGDDRLYGNEGNDNLLGGDGNDVLRGGADDDNMSGGTGDDLYYVDSSEDLVAEFLGQGTDTVHTTASYVLGQHVENLIADSDAGLVLRGNGRNNDITGGSDDRLTGRGGNDTLRGGEGRDILIGGDGNDRFVFDALSDSVTGGGRDKIKDFVSGVDVIDLSGIDANTALANDQAFSFIGNAVFSHTAGELQAKAFGANTLVSGDVDGNGRADFHILLGGAVTLQATDFLL